MSVQEQYRTNFWTNPQRMNEHNVAVAVATHNFFETPCSITHVFLLRNYHFNMVCLFVVQGKYSYLW